MNKETLEKAKTTLEEMKESLERELSRFAKKDPNVQGDWDSKYPRNQQGDALDVEDAAGEVEEYSTRLNIEFSLENKLKNVEAALERVEKGTYGMCGKCDKEIPEARLLAMPESNFCADCADTQ